MFVRALLTTGLGFFYRVKNMGTFDPVKKIYRKDYGTSLVAIPDICGYVYRTRNPNWGCPAKFPITAIPVYIEVKYIKDVDRKRALTFVCKITDEQKRFLLDAHKAGCRSGIAFTLEDCLAIAYCDPDRYPRHPRTWMFLPEPELAIKVTEYQEKKKALSRLKQDPVAAATTLAHGVTPIEG